MSCRGWLGVLCGIGLLQQVDSGRSYALVTMEASVTGTTFEHLALHTRKHLIALQQSPPPPIRPFPGTATNMTMSTRMGAPTARFVGYTEVGGEREGVREEVGFFAPGGKVFNPVCVCRTYL